MRRRFVGGCVLGLGAFLVLLVLAEIAADLWPDGTITESAFVADVLLLVLPGRRRRASLRAPSR